ncbi:aldo/keto reductase [Sporobolomyces salmoneus]|uniref:aldo/keto reductase n=1 Tax=Sporobolomyces salmoneus TaxID=183962 RepID=UPI00316F5C32
MSTYPDIQSRDGGIPGVAYGVGTSLFRQECVEEVKTAIRAGFIHLDLAEIYETTASVGTAIRESGIDPKELYITTKVGEGMKDVNKALNEELSKLGLESVDMFLLHFPHVLPEPGYPPMDELWRQMIECKKSGKAKAIGVSNWRIQDLQKIIDSNPEELPAINQIEYHPFLYEESEPVVQFCRKHKIALAAYSPLAPITRISGGSFDQALEEVAQSVSKRFGEKVSGSSVLLKLASQRGFVVVTTSNKEWRMKEQIGAGALPELTEGEQEKLVQAAKPAPQRAFPEHMAQPDVEY